MSLSLISRLSLTPGDSVYSTDEPSDDIVSAGDSEDFAAHVTVAIASPIPGFVQAPAEPDEVQENMACVGTGCSDPPPALPIEESRQASVSADSQRLLDAAFGTSDDDLSEFTDDESSFPKARIARRTNTATSLSGRIIFESVSKRTSARLVRGGIGKVVLDSDDEAPQAPPLRQARNAKKALIHAPTTDTVLSEDLPFPLA